MSDNDVIRNIEAPDALPVPERVVLQNAPKHDSAQYGQGGGSKNGDQLIENKSKKTRWLLLASVLIVAILVIPNWGQDNLGCEISKSGKDSGEYNPLEAVCFVVEREGIEIEKVVHIIDLMERQLHEEWDRLRPSIDHRVTGTLPVVDPYSYAYENQTMRLSREEIDTIIDAEYYYQVYTGTIVEETPGWRVYVDEGKSFMLSYPSDWVGNIHELTQTIRIENKETGSRFEVIENQNKNKLDLDDWFRETTVVGGRPTAKASAEPVFISGIKAYRIDSGLEIPNPLFEIVGIADSQKNIFSLYAYGGSKGDDELLERILASFKFLE